jgi:predicted SAM-dependent methyltransferase
MKLLNIGCGETRPGEPWVNVDHFSALFEPSSPEWKQIAACPNYVDADITKRLPFDDGSVDGVLLSHVLEHFDAPQGLALLVEAYRVLKPGGIVLVSVPNASYFREVYPEDRNENWPRLFETTDPKNTIPTFFEAALWFNEHKAILTEDAVWCYLKRAGFSPSPVPDYLSGAHDAVVVAMTEQLNRRIFSVEMVGVK